MARVADADRAEVDSEDVERRVGRALEDTRQAAYERVGAERRHGVDHHATGTATREGLHQRRWQSAHEIAVHTRLLDAPLDAADEHVHSAGGTEHTDADEDGHEVGNDAHGGGKAVLGTLDEGVVDVDLLTHTGEDEADDDGHQQNVGNGGAHAVHHLAFQLRETPDDAGYQGTGAAERQQQCAVEEVDALVERRDDDACQRREERGQQDGDEDVGGLGGAHLCAVDEDADGDDGQAAGVQYEEHNHGVRRRVLLRVQLLHLLHGLQAEGRGSIVEAQHVGRNVHEDTARDGMSLRNLREEPCEDGA